MAIGFFKDFLLIFLNSFSLGYTFTIRVIFVLELLIVFKYGVNCWFFFGSFFLESFDRREAKGSIRNKLILPYTA